MNLLLETLQKIFPLNAASLLAPFEFRKGKNESRSKPFLRITSRRSSTTARMKTYKTIASVTSLDKR